MLKIYRDRTACLPLAREIETKEFFTKDKLTLESADLIYHLLVLWADQGIEPADVWAELTRREGISGIAEKKSRPGKDRAG